MYFKLDAKNLYEGFSMVSAAMQLKPSHPILKYFLVSVSPTGLLEVVGTDMSRHLKWRKQLSTYRPGSLCLALGGEGAEFVKQLNVLSGDVEIRSDDCNEEENLKENATPTAFMKCASWVQKLLCKPAVEFLKIQFLPEQGEESEGEDEQPIVSRIRLKRSEFIETVSGASFSIAPKEEKMALNCLKLEIASSTLTVASTDGHRLSWRELHLQDETTANALIHALIPLSALKGMGRLLNLKKENFTIAFGKTSEGSLALKFEQIEITVGEFLYAFRPAEYQYPDWRKLVNDFNIGMPYGWRFKLAHAVEALRRIEFVANQGNGVVEIKCSQEQITFVASSATTGTAKQVISTKSTLWPKDVKDDFIIFLNLKYLKELLASFKFSGQQPEQVLLEANTPTKPFFVSPVNQVSAKGLLMPVQVRADAGVVADWDDFEYSDADPDDLIQVGAEDAEENDLLDESVEPDIEPDEDVDELEDSLAMPDETADADEADEAAEVEDEGEQALAMPEEASNEGDEQMAFPLNADAQPAASVAEEPPAAAAQPKQRQTKTKAPGKQSRRSKAAK